ncbi:MAG: oligosaccharide flippase family protein [Brumimicrobium sp.]
MLKGLNIKSEFLRSVMVLTSGTVIAQVVSYAVTPLITRLFTPEDFGEIGVFLRIVAFLTALGTARYELTLPLPKNDNHAFQLFRLSLKISFYTVFGALFFGLLYWLFTGLESYTLLFVLLVAVATFFMIFKNIGTNWAIRTKAFKVISYSSVLTSVASNGLKLITGLLGFGVMGLILSTIIGTIAGVSFYIYDYILNKRTPSFSKSRAKMYVLSQKYKEFPRVNLPHTLIDTARELLIAFFLTYYLSTSLFGSYDLSFKMLKIPLLLIGTSIGQVLYQKASEKFARNESIYPLLKKTVSVLFLLSILPFGIVFFWGEPLFVFVFGSEWKLAGQIASAIAPWLMFNFIASTISMIPSVINKLRWFFWIGVATSVIQLFFFGLFPQIVDRFNLSAIEFFSVTSWVMTVFFIVVIIWEMLLVRGVDLKS